MAIDSFKLGWNTGGRIVFGTNPFYANKEWTEGDGELTLNVLMTAGEVSRTRTPSVEVMSSIGATPRDTSLDELHLLPER